MSLVKFNSTQPWNQFDWLESLFDSDRIDSMRTNGLPAVNIREKEDGFHLDVSAPGFDKSDFQVEVENETLKVSAETKVNNANEDESYTLREFGSTSFRRMFALPETVDGDKIEAKYTNGILNVYIPKKEEAKPKPAKRIAIK